jgi:hypothetical protein
MMVTTYKITQCHNPENHNLNSDFCKNLKSHIHKKFSVYQTVFILTSNIFALDETMEL